MIKEHYFTPESIDEKARDMLRDIGGLKRRHPLVPVPTRSTLLVLDMQNYFLQESSHAYIPSAPAIVVKINQLIEIYTANNLPVIFTRHQNSNEDAGMMSAWWDDLIRANTHWHEIIPELDTSRGTIIDKSQYDAFYQTGLESVLRDNHINQVVISGVMTHLCCETTARSAFVRGFEVFFTIDGTATYNEPFHRATLWNASHGFAVPVLADEIVENLTVGNRGTTE